MVVSFKGTKAWVHSIPHFLPIAPASQDFSKPDRAVWFGRWSTGHLPAWLVIGVTESPLTAFGDQIESLKKAAATISGWDCPLLTFMYSGFDFACLHPSSFSMSRVQPIRTKRMAWGPNVDVTNPERQTMVVSIW